MSILTLIFTASPAIAAIFASIVSIVKLTKEFKALKGTVTAATAVKDYEAYNLALAEENALLRKDIKTLTEAITKVTSKEV